MTGIKALAQHLDLSIGTVSRALNGKPDVKAETRRRVLAAAKELDYRPNHSGRSLRHGRTNTVGLVLETGSPSTLAGDTFFMHLVDAMQETLAEEGLDLVLLPCRSADDPIEFLRRHVTRRMVDSIVITATRRQDERIAMLLEDGTPFLALGRSETPGAYPWIDLDFAGAARDSVDALVRLGHRRIAIAAPRRDVNLAHIYMEGYRDALAAHGLPVDEALILRASGSENGGVQVAEALLRLEDRPTAVMLGQELMAIGLYSHLAQVGVQPGRDLSVIGFRQSPQLRFLSPALACFALDVRALGKEVGQAVMALSADPVAARGIGRVWPLEYVPAPSVQPPVR
ncbi:putative transcriptional regulator protein [Oceanicola granulosus HTCC2516]|uniref:Putative transcriptional regulator protein n=1 Tax=Oceanicola granulosus (strain ATCC BAA-861 / DSM 15982 / KCTC 12143 / HTCC2516) TaxID=314256 RepID=Q2CKA8_OCEGH|nr:substrate-binding domain-containing protein [Oceanicola granulosus]EAR52881.1 putative transcriptional regulator protein [Oceanicola granulosus HTCC2516]